MTVLTTLHVKQDFDATHHSYLIVFEGILNICNALSSI
jgi:hypothetical protein